MGEVGKSMDQLLKELQNVVKASFNLAPVLALAISLVFILLIIFTLKFSALMPAIILIIVVLVSVIIYANTDRYGEAALALAAGLFSVFSVDWDAGSFVGFIVAWLGFSFFAMFISSFKLAAKSEAIFRHAAVIMADEGGDVSVVESKLKEIGKSSSDAGLGPIEKAEAIRLFAYRKLPIEVIPHALSMTVILSVAAQANYMKVAVFVADIVSLFGMNEPPSYTGAMDIMYNTIKKSPVQPSDFFVAFENSRHVILSRSLDPIQYFIALRKALEQGIRPDKVGERLVDYIPSND